MSDTNLNIQVKVTGNAELDALIAKMAAGTATINEEARAVKLATGVWKDMEPAVRASNVELGKFVSVAKDSIAKGMDPLMGANARMMRSYFQVGERLRQFWATTQMGGLAAKQGGSEVDMFARSIKTAGDFAGTAIGTFQEASGAISGMAMAAQNGGPMLAGIGQKLVAFGGPIALAVAGFALLSSVMAEATEKARLYVLELAKQYDLQVKLGIITPEQQLKDTAAKVNDLTGQYVLLEAAQKKAQSAYNVAISAPSISDPDAEQSRIARINKTASALSEINDKLTGQKTAVLAVQVEYKNLYDAQDKAMQKQSDEWQKNADFEMSLVAEQDKIRKEELAYELDAQKKITDEKKKQTGLLKDEFDFYTKARRSLGLVSGGGNALGQAQSDVKGFKPIGMQAGGDTDVKLTKADEAIGYLKDYNKEMSLGEQAIVGVADGVSNLQGQWTSAISGLIMGTQNIGQAFSSMGRMVVAALTEIIAKMIAMKILSTLLSFIPGLGGAGAVVGAMGGGLPVASVVGGSGGGSDITQMSQSQMGRIQRTGGGYGGGTIVPTQMETRISGNDIVVVHRLAMQERAGRVG